MRKNKNNQIHFIIKKKAQKMTHKNVEKFFFAFLSDLMVHLCVFHRTLRVNETKKNGNKNKITRHSIWKVMEKRKKTRKMLCTGEEGIFFFVEPTVEN